MTRKQALGSLVSLLVLFFSGEVLAVTIMVPRDYPTIQQAIDAAVPGDTVLVSAGTYDENIDFNGKAIRVEAMDEGVVIDGAQNGTVVTFKNGEGRNSMLLGFKITNGTGTLYNGEYYGGGILCGNPAFFNQSASPTIQHNVIVYNGQINPSQQGELKGGGICCVGEGSTPLINHNIIGREGEGNIAYQGGGIFCIEAIPRIEDNNISYNTAIGCCSDMLANGGAICCYSCPYQNPGKVVIEDNTMMYNQGGEAGGFAGGGGAIFSANSRIDILDNIIQENIARNTATVSSWGGGICVCDTGTTLIKYNFIKDNVAAEGGGVYVHATTKVVTVDTNRIASNTAYDCGGGIYWWGTGGDYYIVNNLLVLNEVSDGGTGGGGIYMQRGDCHIWNNTIVYNNALGVNGTGGGVYLDENLSGPWAYEVVNTIAYCNQAQASGAQIYKDPLATTAKVEWCCVQGGFSGNGNFSNAPIFLGSPPTWFKLQRTTNPPNPCIDSGDPLRAPAVDFENEARPDTQPGLVDVGWDECHL